MEYRKLFEGNEAWAARIHAEDPTFFERQASGQQPTFLFIGCCDSRVPFELLSGLNPGDVFVHRNIANQAHPTDLSMLSALEYAVDVLDVKHVLVCGHYQCGGVKAAMSPPGHMVVDNWLQGVRDTCIRHEEELATFPETSAQFDRLVELNVHEQIYQLSRSPIVLSAWKRGTRPILHGIVYDVNTGLLKEIVPAVASEAEARQLRTQREYA